MTELTNGMLWSIDPGHTVSDAVAAAAKYHQEKYGPVNTVHVNVPVNDPIFENRMINVVMDTTLYPGNIWIGWVPPRKESEPR